MRIVGINITGNDHAISFWDTKKNDFFAISLERITRIKHDNKGLQQIKKHYPEYFKNIDMVCVGSSGDNGHSISMNQRLICRLNLRNFIYEKYKPKYLKDQKKLYEQLTKNPLRLGFIDFLKAGIYFIQGKLSSSKNSHSSVKKYLKVLFPECSQIFFYDHHKSHCASSFFSSPFLNEDNVLLVSIDGFGDGHFSKAIITDKNKKFTTIRVSKTWLIPNATTTFNVFSLGIIYANFTEAMGLQVNSEEGKVEALAAFGNYDQNIYKQLNENIIIKDGEILGLPGIEKFYDLSWLKSIKNNIGEENFCATVQKFLDETLGTYVEQLKQITKSETICLSGGVVANVIANLHVFEKKLFKNIYIVPPMADDGTSVGALALGAIDMGLDVKYANNSEMPYWGPSISNIEIKNELEIFKDKIEFIHYPLWQEEVSRRLESGKIGCIVRGKMEFGPRALGNRSIIASPIFGDMIDRINLNIKKRPKYQPFCPSCLEEERERLFEISYLNKHMTAAFRLKKEFYKSIPAACHIDLTARPQFVNKVDNEEYYNLLLKMKEKTGFGVLINTSFNKHGRTIVRTANDALVDFIDCVLDFMVLGDYLVTKKNDYIKQIK